MKKMSIDVLLHESGEVVQATVSADGEVLKALEPDELELSVAEILAEYGFGDDDELAVELGGDIEGDELTTDEVLAVFDVSAMPVKEAREVIAPEDWIDEDDHERTG